MTEIQQFVSSKKLFISHKEGIGFFCDSKQSLVEGRDLLVLIGKSRGYDAYVLAKDHDEMMSLCGMVLRNKND